MEARHAKLPWAIHSEQKNIIESPSAGYFIADVFSGHATSEANAEFIVRACNAHDDLVAALQTMLEQFSKVPSTLADSEARSKAHAAIAKATGAA